MTSEQWEKLEFLFHQARDCPASERGALLDSACEGDAALRRELDEMLAVSNGPEMDFDAPVRHTAGSFLLEQDVGARVGPYRILSMIGKGGMGAVYLAQREEEYEQKVAVKVVDPELLRSPDVLARFRFERQILAQLNHPKIALLLDGGVTSRRIPYLVMEYVDGVPIDRYCAQHQLNTRQRIGLFRQVLEGVAHAHQHLVVHRDIKPGNILVTAEGAPKLLDFGIAKALQADNASLTRTKERLLTPAYASPEQVKGEAVSTAADVYSLGTLLYQLLTGRLPFDAENRKPFELEIAICQEEPARPGLLAKIDPDLEAIVLKAMRKEPARRHASVAEFDEDLRCYLEGYPVGARRGGWRYAAGKYAGRHRAALAAAALVVAALAWGGISTRLAQARAERRFVEVRELATAFLFDFHDSIANLPGATKAREMVLARAIVYLDRLATESAGDPTLQMELAKGYDKLRDIRFRGSSSNVGRSAQAIESGNKAVALWNGVVVAHPADPQARAGLAESEMQLGSVLSSTRTPEEAQAHLRRSIALYEQALEQEPGNSKIRSDLSDAYYYLGEYQIDVGNAAEARALIGKAIAVKQQFTQTHRSADSVLALARQYMSLGDVDRVLTQDWKKAEGNYLATLRLAEESLRLSPQGDAQLRLVAQAHERLAIILGAAGRPKEALPHSEADLAGYRELAEKDPENADNLRGMSAALANRGTTLMQLGDISRAIESFRRSIACNEQILRQDPTALDARDNVAKSVSFLGLALDATPDQQGARAAFERAVAIREPIAKASPDRLDVQKRLSANYFSLAIWHARHHDCARAGDYYSKSLRVLLGLKDARKVPDYVASQADKLRAFGARNKACPSLSSLFLTR